MAKLPFLAAAAALLWIACETPPPSPPAAGDTAVADRDGATVDAVGPAGSDAGLASAADAASGARDATSLDAAAGLDRGPGLDLVPGWDLSFGVDVPGIDVTIHFDAAIGVDLAGIPGLDAGAVDGADPCKNVSAAGCCAGTVVYSCLAGQLQSYDCAPDGCGWSDTLQLFKCNGHDTPPTGVVAICPEDL